MARPPICVFKEKEEITVMVSTHRSAGMSLAHVVRHGNSACSSLRAKRLGAWQVLFCAFFLLAFGASAHAGSPPAVQFLGVPKSVFSSSISSPFGLAVDNSGNVYIASYGTHQVLKETLQGDGTYVQSTIDSSFSEFEGGPVGLAVDDAGNLFIGFDGECTTSCLLKETLQGDGTYVRSYIGSALVNVWGIAIDPNGNLFVASEGTVYKFIPSGSTYTSHTIQSPNGTNTFVGASLDSSGDLFLASDGQDVFHKLTPTGDPATTLTYTLTDFTIPGTEPLGIAVDSGGNLYVGDLLGSLHLETPNGTGGYTDAVLESGQGSYGVTLSPTGTLYFGVTTQVDEFGPGAVNMGAKAVKSTTSVTNLRYTVEPGTVVGAINVVSQGMTNTMSGSPEFVQATGSTCTVQTYSGKTTCAVSVTFTPQFPGLRTGAVQFLDGSQNVLSTVYLYGTGQGALAGFSPGTVSVLSTTGAPLSGPRRPIVDSMGNLYVANYTGTTVVEISPAGVSTVVATPGLTLAAPAGTALDGAGNLFINDSGNQRVVEVTPAGTASVLDSNGLSLAGCYGMAVDGSGNVYTACSVSKKVVVFPPSGLAYALPTPGVTLVSPYGVAVDASGNIFVSDDGASDIVKVSGSTASVVNLGSITLSDNRSISVDAPGNLYISDSGNNRIVEVPAGGGTPVVLSTAPLTLSLPVGTGVGVLGDLYIADAQNNRIVVSSQETAPALTFKTSTVIGTADGTDDPQSVTLLNLGNAALTIASATFATTTPSTGTSFTDDTSTTCTGSLAANSSCVFGVDFIPAAAGSNVGSITLTDNTLGATGSTQTVSLNGTGIPALTAFTITAYPSTVQAGNGASFTVTAMNGTNVATNYTGTVTFTSSDSMASFGSTSYTFTGGDAGVHTFTNGVYLHTVGNQTITAADTSASVSQTSSNIAVTAGIPSTIRATGGSGQSAVIGAAFTNPLGVLVTDSWSNPVSGVTVNYTAPTSGASATLSSNGSVVTASDGTASLNAVANSTAGGYTVTAGSSSINAHVQPNGPSSMTAKPDAPASTTARFTLTNSMATPSIALTPSPASPTTYGQSQTTLGATVSYSTGTPTGTVTFSDGSTQLGSAVALSAGAATYAAQYYGAGRHAFTAAYSGDSNYNVPTAATSTYIVNQASSTLTGPTTQPVFVIYQNAGSIPVSVTGQYSGTGIAPPSGSVTYTITLGSTQISTGGLTIASGAVSVPVASTLAPGIYNVALAYSGDTNYNAATAINVGLQVGQIQPTISWSTPSPIVYGATLNGVLNAVAMNGSATVPGTYAYTATPAGGSASAVTNASKLVAGTYTLSVLFTPTDANTYKTANGSVTLVVGKATPSVSLTSTANPVLVQNSITLTATVSSSVSTPTGSVTFLDGTTPIGTGTVNASGLATLAISTLSVGSHSITAVYSGDSNFVTLTSSALTQLVQDFNLTISTSGSGGSAGITSVTSLPGGTAVFTFTLSPVGSATFPATVTLSASGLPAGATYTFSPATLAAGAGATQVTLTVNLPQVSAAGQAPVVRHAASPAEMAQNKSASKLPYLALALLLLPFTRRMRRASRKLGRLLPLLLLLIAGLAALTGLSGCSSTSGYFGQAPATYTITVTGTAGALTHSTSVTLTVE